MVNEKKCRSRGSKLGTIRDEKDKEEKEQDYKTKEIYA